MHDTPTTSPAQDNPPDHKATGHAFEIKRLMAVSLSRPNARKDAAIDCGVVPSALSHWLSLEKQHALPVDLLVAFCSSCGSVAVLQYLADQLGYDLVPR